MAKFLKQYLQRHKNLIKESKYSTGSGKFIGKSCDTSVFGWAGQSYLADYSEVYFN